MGCRINKNRTFLETMCIECTNLAEMLIDLRVYETPHPQNEHASVTTSGAYRKHQHSSKIHSPVTVTSPGAH